MEETTISDKRVTKHLLALDISLDVLVRTRTREQAEAPYKAAADYVIIPDELTADALLESLEPVFADDIALGDLRQSKLRSLRESEWLNERGS
ncbi:hypothetical protein [Halalkalirubrum salinum]|uniref:hypothetical protein n=1 Tax=Halalkalirubrum salinum TaxID=2563889 RepID=UPI0010FB8FAD|nr:hypothetical protein [Halalkalirubrum salinum]